MKDNFTDFGLILDVVSDHYNIEKIKIFSKSRKREVVRIRQEFQYLCRVNNPQSVVSYESIGAYYSDKTDNRWDHSSIVNSCKKVSGFMKIYPDFRNNINEISQKIRFKKHRLDNEIKEFVFTNLKIIEKYKQDINNQTL